MMTLNRGCRKPVLRHNISVLRQRLITQYDPGRGVSISTLAYEYPRGFQVPEHAHGSDQLVYAIRGVMELSAGPGIWLIPPHFGMWIPVRTFHSIKMPGAVSMRTLYMRRGLASRLPTTCTVFHITPLLRELIVETVRIKELRMRNRLHCALRDLHPTKSQRQLRVRVAYRKRHTDRGEILYSSPSFDWTAGSPGASWHSLLGNPTEWVWRRSERWGAVTCFPPSFLHAVFLPRERHIP